MEMSNKMAPTQDPNARCEESCTHDLARGVLVEELAGGDGPHTPISERQGTGGGLWTDGRAQGEESAA
jgi:hypothetical protein